MSQSENKPQKLSEVARQSNADKAKRFGSTMIPSPPLPKQPAPEVNEPTPPVVEPPVEASLPEVAQPQTEEPAPTAKPTPTPVKATRSRRSGALTIDEVISGEPPKGEAYPRQMRVSEHHHKMLRKLAFNHDVTMNHVLYNLLDLLDQADQRDQQKGD